MSSKLGPLGPFFECGQGSLGNIQRMPTLPQTIMKADHRRVLGSPQNVRFQDRWKKGNTQCPVGECVRFGPVGFQTQSCNLETRLFPSLSPPLPYITSNENQPPTLETELGSSASKREKRTSPSGNLTTDGRQASDWSNGMCSSNFPGRSQMSGQFSFGAWPHSHSDTGTMVHDVMTPQTIF